VQKLASATCLIVIPLTHILGTVSPSHSALSMSQSSAPLAIVNSSSWVLVLFCYQRLVWIKQLFCQCLLVFSFSKILCLRIRGH
jgi:hypothetical protein